MFYVLEYGIIKIKNSFISNNTFSSRRNQSVNVTCFGCNFCAFCKPGVLQSVLSDKSLTMPQGDKLKVWFYQAFFPTGATIRCWYVFYSPLAGYSLLAYEVSWSHTTTRHSR
jgi:hypothetical protein